MIKGVLFDMDGLLIDSEPIWREGEMRIFDKFGIKLSEDDCRSTTGMRVDQVIEHWQLRFPNVPLNNLEVIKAINDEVTHLIVEKGNPLPGVYETIAFFQELEIPMALASSSGMQIIDAVVKKLNLQNDLKFWQSAEFLRFGKPNPEVFIIAADKLGVSYSNCLVFEDSIYGVIAAKAARMPVIAVPELVNFDRPEYVLADAKLGSLVEFTPSLFRSLYH